MQDNISDLVLTKYLTHDLLVQVLLGRRLGREREVLNTGFDAQPGAIGFFDAPKEAPERPFSMQNLKVMSSVSARDVPVEEETVPPPQGRVENSKVPRLFLDLFQSVGCPQLRNVHWGVPVFQHDQSQDQGRNRQDKQSQVAA